MRKLFTVLVSLHLILTPVAFAKPTGAGDQFRASQSSKGGGMDFYMNQVLSLGTGLIGTGILLDCPLAIKMQMMSLPTYMAGSLIYIGKEILGGKDQQKYHQRSSDNLKILEEKLKNGGDFQRETLEAALKEEKEILSIINKRKMWMMAVTAVYTAATALAITEILKENSPVGPIGPKPPGPIPVCPGGGLAGFAKSKILQAAIVGAYTFGVGNAGGGPISQYGGMAIALGRLVPALALKIKILYNTAVPRSISFGASAALAAGVTAGLAKKAGIVKGNIEKLEKALAEFDSGTKNTPGLIPTGGATSGETDGSGAGTGNIKTAAGTYNALPTGQETNRACWTQTPEGMQFTENACKGPIRLASPTFDSNINLPTLEAATVAATDLANSVASGDSAKADVQAAGLANMATRLDQVKDNLEKQLNDKLIADGKKPIDFDGGVNSQIAGMANTATGGKGAGDTSLAKLDSSNALEKSSERTEFYQEIKGAAGTATLGGPSLSEGSSATTITEGDTTIVEEKGDISTLSQYEMNEADVSKQSDVSLFQQLSNRYLLAYPKIFETKKLEEAPPVKLIEN